MEPNAKIENVSKPDIAGFLMLRMPTLYRDFGITYDESDAKYISIRIADFCHENAKIRVCPIGIIGQSIDRALTGEYSGAKITAKLMLKWINKTAEEFGADKRAMFITEQEKKNRDQKNQEAVSANNPIVKAVLWRMAKRCDGIDLNDVLSIEEIASAYSNNLNPDNVFRDTIRAKMSV